MSGPYAMKPKIVLVITDQETNAQLAKLGVGLLELRADLFKSRAPDHVARQIAHRRKLGIPLLLTVRNQKKEGALKEFSDAAKWEILERFIPAVDWVDVELSSPLCAKVVALARKTGTKVMVSAHDFRQTPHRLDDILKKALSTRADMVKIAAWARSSDDVLRMFEFTHRNRKHPLVTMSLGPWGAVSRLLLPLSGSRWVYTFLGAPKAPGQVDIHALQRHLNRYYK